MQFWIDEQLQETEIATLEQLDQSWKSSTAKLFSANRFIHYVEIDGDRFYDGYETIITTNFPQIQSVKLYSISRPDALTETVGEMVRYQENMLQLLDKVSSPFYGIPQQEDWDLFQQFCAGLEWLHQSASLCLSVEAADAQAAEVMGRIQSFVLASLRQIEALMEEQDFTSIADFLSYELTPQMQDLQTALKGVQADA